MSSPHNIQSLLGLSRPPVAIAFLDAPPPGVDAWSGGPVAAGCVFWKKAQEGAIFYTLPADHYNCAVGAYVHKIALPAERAPELESTLGFMVENRYLAMEEVPDIPTLLKTPGAIAYGPVDRVSFTPDVVLLAVTPAQAMLLYEAALKAAASEPLIKALGRPACAILPLARNAGTASLSLGCVGNRTYTGVPSSEMYLAVPGDKWDALVEEVLTVLAANDAVGAHHRQRQAQFAGV